MQRTRRPPPDEIPVFVASPSGLKHVGGIPLPGPNSDGEPARGHIGGVEALFKWSRGRMVGIYVYSAAEAEAIVSSFESDRAACKISGLAPAA